MKLLKKTIGYCKRCATVIYHTGRTDFNRKYTKEVEPTPEPAQTSWPRRVLTGLQPTGQLHVGNYFGAVRRCVRLQDAGEDLMLCIADLHSLTTVQDGPALEDRVLDMTAYLLASGLDPDRCVLFVQSAVPRHAELCWLLTCLATYARVAQLPQYKEKGGAREAGLGLLAYPVLQAADVLLYRATHVPVGGDQLQHLQVAAQLVKTFHHRYRCHLFPTPRAILPDDGSLRLKSLRDPTKKMSKSDPDPKSRILLADSDDVIKKKIKKAVTDFIPQVTYDPESRPGVSNLISLHCLATDAQPEEAVEEADALTTAQYKEVVGAALCAALGPVRERARALRARPALLREALRHGAARARARADRVYADVAAAAGLAR